MVSQQETRLSPQLAKIRKSSFSVSKTDLLLETLREEQISSSQRAAREFIEQTMETVLPSKDLHEALKDGVVLCNLMNRLQPNIISQVDKKDYPFVKISNISNFLNAARKFGLHNSDLFETVDLFEGKDMERVVGTILAIARVAAGKYVHQRSCVSMENAGKDSINHIVEQHSEGESDTDEPLEIKGRRRGKTNEHSRKIKNAAHGVIHNIERKNSSEALSRHAYAVNDQDELHTDVLDERATTATTTATERRKSIVHFDAPTHVHPDKNSSAPELHGRSFDKNIKDGDNDGEGDGDDTFSTTLPGPTLQKRPSLRKSMTMDQLYHKQPLHKPQESEFNDNAMALPSLQAMSLSSSSVRPDTRNNAPKRSPSRTRTHVRYKSDRTSEIMLSKVDRSDGMPEVTRRRESIATTTFQTAALPREREQLVLKEGDQVVAAYKLGNCIGKGQFGSVYRALNMNTGQMVAIKRIKLEGRKQDEIHQLMQEVELLRSLSHPSVVKYEACIRTDEYINIIMEYVENGSLLNTLKSFSNFPEKLVASYVVKILEGLVYLHTKQVVHCDLKAANILTTKNGNVKLSDFGVSLNLKMMENGNKDVAGTPNWMAPEVIKLKGASTASDIWSLGCTIIELLTGKPPYAGLMAMATMYRIVEDKCPPLPRNVSRDCSDFLSLCFQKNPTLRPTARDLFKHPWIQNNWMPELRTQDSLPFLRRITSENNVSDLQNAISMTSAFHNTLSTTIHNSSANSLLIEPNSSAKSPMFALPLTSPVGSPVHSQYAFTTPMASPSAKMYVATPMVPHRFVKNSFSKPVECRICHNTVKNRAVMCEECNMVCHVKCQSDAPFPCPLPNRMVMYTPLGVIDEPLSPSRLNSLSSQISDLDQHNVINAGPPTPTAAGSMPIAVGSTPTVAGSTPPAAGSTPTAAGPTPTAAGSASTATSTATQPIPISGLSRPPNASVKPHHRRRFTATRKPIRKDDSLNSTSSIADSIESSTSGGSSRPGSPMNESAATPTSATWHHANGRPVSAISIEESGIIIRDIAGAVNGNSIVANARPSTNGSASGSASAKSSMSARLRKKVPSSAMSNISKDDNCALM